ncbi:MAG TPA: hypothetical protein VN782_07225 [Usitatibacter sp.]|nr:hypothetical protein [Usitatibacter sp.]
MNKAMQSAGLVAALSLLCATALAKLPPPAPMDPAQKEAAAAKKKAADEKAKAELAAAEERTVKNYQANMKKEGKPIPKPVPVAAASTPAKGGEKKPQANTQKASAKKG